MISGVRSYVRFHVRSCVRSGARFYVRSGARSCVRSGARSYVRFHVRSGARSYVRFHVRLGLYFYRVIFVGSYTIIYYLCCYVRFRVRFRVRFHVRFRVRFHVEGSRISTNILSVEYHIIFSGILFPILSHKFIFRIREPWNIVLFVGSYTIIFLTLVFCQINCKVLCDIFRGGFSNLSKYFMCRNTTFFF